ncbi:unnamed protein product, partial [Prorocentrum cordatum]
MHPGPACDGMHLLAAAHRAGSGVAARSEPPLGLSGRHPGRLQHFVLHLGASRAVHFMNCYGYRNADLILEAVEWVRGLGDVPAFVVGDLNCQLASSGLDGLLAMAGWRDLLAAAGPTCIPSQKAPSRIDYVLGNPAAQDIVETVGLRWDLGLATHAALLMTIKVGSPEPALIRQSVPPLDGPPADGWTPQCARDMAVAIQAAHGGAFQQALDRQDLDGAWEVLSLAMRTWLSARLGRPAVVARPHAAAAWMSERPKARGGGGDAADAAADAALLRLWRLRSLQHAHGRTSPEAALAACATLRALRTADSGNPAWAAMLSALTPGGTFPAHVIDRAEADWRQAQDAARRRRRGEWRRWAQDAMANSQGRLYRWIRGGGTLEAELVPAPPAAGAAAATAPILGHRTWALALQGGPAARLRYFEGPWRALWQQPASAAVPEAWQQELDGLPPVPDRTPWTGDVVSWLLRKMPRRKKPGLDAWTVSELRLLPAQLCGWIAQMFEAVEAVGGWPRELVEAEDLLLPKPGGGEGPLERRPIWLLP